MTDRDRAIYAAWLEEFEGWVRLRPPAAELLPDLSAEDQLGRIVRVLGDSFDTLERKDSGLYGAICWGEDEELERHTAKRSSLSPSFALIEASLRAAGKWKEEWDAYGDECERKALEALYEEWQSCPSHKIMGAIRARLEELSR